MVKEIVWVLLIFLICGCENLASNVENEQLDSNPGNDSLIDIKSVINDSLRPIKYFNEIRHGYYNFSYPDGSLKAREYYENGDLVYYEHYNKDGEIYDRVMLPILDAPRDTIELGESYIGKYRFPFPLKSKLLLTIGEMNSSGKRLKKGFAFVRPNEEGEFEYEFTPKSAGLNSITGIFVQKDTTVDSISVHGQMFTDGFVVKLKEE